uniref:Uncharacterized protein n=1 Tax=uncultured prokaryote TaxID=198431 RepID=A0A0H5Q582_9ZZZZ|nr:hypothetical protein [uncultured prokaryote]
MTNMEIVDEMKNFCEKEKIYNFCDLFEYASKNRKDWFDFLVTEKNCVVMALYLIDKSCKAGLITPGERSLQYQELLEIDDADNHYYNY